jgi:hypothetical protein
MSCKHFGEVHLLSVLGCTSLPLFPVDLVVCDESAILNLHGLSS